MRREPTPARVAEGAQRGAPGVAGLAAAVEQHDGEAVLRPQGIGGEAQAVAPGEIDSGHPSCLAHRRAGSRMAP